MFKHDLLMMDLEFSGVDDNKHEIIQIAGVLLDKKTLKQKKAFASYVKPKNWKGRDPEAMAVNNIVWDDLKDAPDIKTALRKFLKTFGTDVTITIFGGRLDIVFLSKAFSNQKLKYPFDYHTYDMWPLCYTFMAKRKLLKNRNRHHGFSLENVGDYLRVPRMDGRHNAVGDCMYQAEVLRALLKVIKAEK